MRKKKDWTWHKLQVWIHGPRSNDTWCRRCSCIGPTINWISTTCETGFTAIARYRTCVSHSYRCCLRMVRHVDQFKSAWLSWRRKNWKNMTAHSLTLQTCLKHLKQGIVRSVISIERSFRVGLAFSKPLSIRGVVWNSSAPASQGSWERIKHAEARNRSDPQMSLSRSKTQTFAKQKKTSAMSLLFSAWSKCCDAREPLLSWHWLEYWKCWLLTWDWICRAKVAQFPEIRTNQTRSALISRIVRNWPKLTKKTSVIRCNFWNSDVGFSWLLPPRSVSWIFGPQKKALKRQTMKLVRL